LPPDATPIRGLLMSDDWTVNAGHGRSKDRYDGRMFEAAAELWKEYLPQVSNSWPEGDARHNLGSEVRNRLRYIDLILRHLRDAISAVTPDPVEIQRRQEWALSNRDRVASGEMTKEEFIFGAAGTPPSNPASYLDSWDDVWIFTETFYFCAWRMVEVLNRSKPHEFPGLGRVRARSITIVRNHLIEHPEKIGESRDFTMGLVILSSGPVLRTTGAVVRGDSGRIDPSPESKDRGLFTAAEELREELERRFASAIAKAEA
jgi:hypothetical protein